MSCWAQEEEEHTGKQVCMLSQPVIQNKGKATPQMRFLSCRLCPHPKQLNTGKLKLQSEESRRAALQQGALCS